MNTSCNKSLKIFYLPSHSISFVTVRHLRFIYLFIYLVIYLFSYLVS